MSFKFSVQNLLKIRGITAKEIALKSGLNHSTIQKTISNDRKGRIPRQAIAGYLQVDYNQIWGIGSARHIKQLIRKAIEERAEQKAASEVQRLNSRYLGQSLPVSKQIING